MRYMSKDDARSVRYAWADCPNIHRSGSVLGMQMQYGWPKRGQVRVGEWVYNVGPYLIRLWEKEGLIRG